MTDDEDVQWMLKRLVPTPFRHFSDPVRIAGGEADALPRAYIRCRGFRNPRFDRHAAAARSDNRWRYRELSSSHHPYVTIPDALVETLLEISS